jgi:nitroimidazol reductase NimA-like FMN-containing flavoprotein (pyridoxamine 5'-phosphate oxidase superfamily)
VSASITSPRPSLDRPLSPTARSTPRRLRERGRRDRAELYAVLDEALICHLGVVVDDAPLVLPTCFGYLGDVLYLHGSTGAVSLRAGAGAPVCVTVTLVDGLVYARSVFHHSANYRSAVVHGSPRLVTDQAEKLAGLRAIVEHTAPGSWEHARQPTTKELAATAVLALDLTEASVKVRSGPPVDDPADVARGAAWAGVLPVRTVFGEPRPSPDLPADASVPPHLTARVSAEPPASSPRGGLHGLEHVGDQVDGVLAAGGQPDEPGADGVAPPGAAVQAGAQPAEAGRRRHQ